MQRGEVLARDSDPRPGIQQQIGNISISAEASQSYAVHPEPSQGQRRGNKSHAGLTQGQSGQRRGSISPERVTQALLEQRRGLRSSAGVSGGLERARVL